MKYTLSDEQLKSIVEDAFSTGVRVGDKLATARAEEAEYSRLAVVAANIAAVVFTASNSKPNN